MHSTSDAIRTGEIRGSRAALGRARKPVRPGGLNRRRLATVTSTAFSSTRNREQGVGGATARSPPAPYKQRSEGSKRLEVSNG